MANTAKPCSSSASTTGPRGVSIATAICAGAVPVTWHSQAHSSASAAPSWATSRSATRSPLLASTQMRCIVLAQSNPTNHRNRSSITSPAHPSLCLLGAAGHRDASSTPVLALEARTFYWTSVAAVLPGHMSYDGARGTGGLWWLPADRPVRKGLSSTCSRTPKAYRVG
jgi:hypothetical protein